MSLVTVSLDVNDAQDNVLFKISAEKEEAPFTKELLWLANGIVFMASTQSMLLAKIGKNIMEGKSPTYGLGPEVPEAEGQPVIVEPTETITGKPLEEVGGPVLINE